MTLSKRAFERKVTFGFKLLSGYHTNRIAKDDLDALGRHAGVPWGSGALEGKINSAWSKLMDGSAFFRYWKSWDTPLADAASDAVAMDFVLLMVKDWQRHGGPDLAGGAPRAKYLRDMHTLFDKRIYEYVTGVWKGSSDSRIGDNLDAFDSGNYADFQPVGQEEWTDLLDEIIDDGMIRARSYLGKLDKRVRLLLLYHYCLDKQSGPDEDFEWDHIIPQTLFKSVSENYARNRHHIANLAALPKKDNTRKGDKTLCTISGMSSDFDRAWLTDQIETYTGIKAEDFDDYCKAKDSDELVATRGPRIRQSILNGRLDLLEG